MANRQFARVKERETALRLFPVKDEAARIARRKGREKLEESEKKGRIRTRADRGCGPAQRTLKGRAVLLPPAGQQLAVRKIISAIKRCSKKGGTYEV